MSQAITTVIELPCGYMSPDGKLLSFVTLREMQTAEEKIMGSSDPDVFKVVGNCIVGIGDEENPALISDRHTLTTEVLPELLKGDYDWILIQLRILSLGSEYDYGVLCRNPRCNKESSHTFDLDNIEVIDMPDPMEREILWTSRGGSVLTFRHLRGSDTPIMEEIQQSNQDILGKTLAMHLVAVDGVPVDQLLKHRKVKNDRQRLNAAVKALDKHVPSYGERTEIRVMLKNKLGKPDVDVISKCPHCAAEWTHRMPIDPGFLYPSAM